jgi:hypothetical protein
MNQTETAQVYELKAFVSIRGGECSRGWTVKWASLMRDAGQTSE